MSQIEGISVETLMLANKYTDEHGGGGGEATDAGSVSYDETKTYKEGTVGAELTAQSRHLSDVKSALNTKAPIIINTASGAVASFTDGADNMPIKALTVNVEPIQAGSGDPSPDNVRPISGRTSATIYHSGADTSDPTTYTIQLGNTVYGGTLDVTGGKMVVTHVYLQKNTVDMDNNEDYPGWRDCGVKDIVGVGLNGTVSNVLTNISPLGARAIGINTRAPSDVILLNVAYFNKSQSEWQAIAQDVQFVIPLSTPLEIPLTPTQISTLLGTNNIWSDGGAVDVEYRADTKLYIDNKIAELQALVLENMGG